MDPRYNTQFTQQNSGNNDWLSKLNQIKEARKEYSKIEHILTPYERQTIYGNIRADADANYGKVYNGVKAHFEGAISNYKAAAAKRASAIAKEINSWDAAKLNAELQAFQTHVNMELSKKDAQGIFSGQPAARRIEQLYQEAQASGDRYKIRAAAEVLRAADLDKLPDEQRFNVQMIAHAANETLEGLRNTDDIKNAIELENAAVKAMQEAQAFVKEAGEVMFDGGAQVFGRDVSNFGKLASTVKFEREAGSVKIRILDANDPEITGIDWNETTLEQLKKQQEGQQ